MSQLISIALISAVLALTSANSAQSDHGYGIIGGELADITELPHQVYIKRGSAGVWCGGSIISPQHILTTSGCTLDPELKRVIAATTDTENGGDEYTLAKITKHSEENIAVIKLAEKIKLSTKAKPIGLAGPKYKINNGAELIASGWGDTENYDRTDKLRKVKLDKVDDAACKDAFPYFNSSKQFCAGGKGRKTCLFDDGGPLIEKTSKRNVLVGVIQGWDCSDRQKPSLFTRVSTFSKWIKKIVKEDLENDE